MKNFSPKIFVLFFFLALANSHKLSEEETLAFEAPDEVKVKVPYYLSGYDEDGAPIWVIEIGKYDLRYFVEKGGKLFDAVDIYIDQILLTAEQSGKNSSTGFIFIGDLEGFDIRQARHFPTVQFIIKKFTTFEHIVGRGSMKKGWLLNANFLWERIWQLASPLLGNLVNNIEVFGTNKEKWLPKLLKELPRDQLPEWYGGEKSHKPVKILG